MSHMWRGGATDLAEQVKSLVTVQEAAEQYGFHPNRAGYIRCPFHNEKTASLKIYDGQSGFHCFGCGAHGSVIDFVMLLYDISFRQAIVRINNDFSLGLTGERPDPAARSGILEARRRETRQKAELERMEELYRKLAREHQYWWNVLIHRAPAGAKGVGSLYLEATKWQPYLEYLLDELEQTTEEVKTGRGREDSAATPGRTA